MCVVCVGVCMCALLSADRLTVARILKRRHTRAYAWFSLSSLMIPVCFLQFRPPEYRASEHAHGQLEWNMCAAGMVSCGAARHGWAVSGAEVCFALM